MEIESRDFYRQQELQHVQQRAIVRYCHKEREADIIRGPFKVFHNDAQLYYEAWILVEPKDPYNEPFLANVKAEDVLRDRSF